MPTDRFATVEDAYKALSDMRAEIRSLKERDAGRAQKDALFDRVKDDLVALQRTVVEAQQTAARRDSGADALAVRFYTAPERLATGQMDRTVRHGVRVRALEHKGGRIDWGICDDPNPRTEWQKALQDALTRRTLVRAYMGLRTGEASPLADDDVRAALRMAPEAIQRVFNDTATEGAEWIPDGFLPSLIRAADEGRRVEALFGTIQMTRKVEVLPYLGKSFQPYIVGQATSDEPAAFKASDAVTADRTLTAVSIAIRAVVDEDSSEDQVLGALDALLLPEIATAMADGDEDAIINGDTNSTHDDDVVNWNPSSRWGGTLGGSGDHRRAYLGLRAAANDKSNTADRGTTTDAKLLGLIASLDGGFRRKDTGVFIGNEQHTLFELMDLDSFQTLDKYGPQATVLAGELGKIYGRPLVLSPFMTADLNASGVYDDTTTTQAGLLYVDRSRFKVGIRAASRVAVVSEPHKGIRHLVVKQRKTFKDLDSASADKNVGYSYNLDVS